jgi:hypothetical protein
VEHKKKATVFESERRLVNSSYILNEAFVTRIDSFTYLILDVGNSCAITDTKTKEGIGAERQDFTFRGHRDGSLVIYTVEA